MKQHALWKTPKTTRVYLQRVGAQRLILLQPDFKVVDMDLRLRSGHFNQPAWGVHLLCGSLPDELDYHETVWDRPSGGLPIYTLRGTDPENGASVSMTAFCDDRRVPLTYCAVTVRNPASFAVDGTLGLLPRTTHQDHNLTNLWDTGYEPYRPDVQTWYLCWYNAFAESARRYEYISANGYGHLRLLDVTSCRVSWVSRGDQKNRFEAHDYVRIDYSLLPGEEKTFTFVMSRDALPDKVTPYDDALDEAEQYWAEIQSRVTTLPDTEGPAVDAFRQNITVALQMLVHYEECEEMMVRQGCVGRYFWPWEAMHLLIMLDTVGLGEYAKEAIPPMLRLWQKVDGDERGRILDGHSNWDNATGAVLGAAGYHLTHGGTKEEFEELRPYLLRSLRYIQFRRSKSKAENGEVEGLFSNGRASDWGDVGQHWTYTDAVNARCLTFLAEAFEKYGDYDAHMVRSAADDYSRVILGIVDRFEKETEGQEAAVPPHILGLPFEETYRHCFYSDGLSYLINLGYLAPERPLCRRLENAYREMGFLDDVHGLTSRMTNDDCGAPGLYGHVYYTFNSDLCWLQAYLARGEKEKADVVFRGLMKYGLTAEYIPSERYCSVDEWFSPWQPNGSSAARLCFAMLMYYGRSAD